MGGPVSGTVSHLIYTTLVDSRLGLLTCVFAIPFVMFAVPAHCGSIAIHASWLAIVKHGRFRSSEEPHLQRADATALTQMHDQGTLHELSLYPTNMQNCW